MKKLVFVLTFFIFLGGVRQSTGSFLTDTEKAENNILSVATDWGITPTPTPTYFANYVVISEVQITGGTGKTDNDFVEFYNPTSTPFDFKGHRLVKRIRGSSTDITLKSWTSTAIIPAYGFYLWANSSDGFALSIGADASTSGYLTDNNSVALRFGAENTGIIIDSLSWDSSPNSLKEGTEFSPNPGANQSIERKAYSTSTPTSMFIGGADEFKGNGFDSNNNATDFVLRSVSQPQNSSSSPEIP